jgi:uncharacterized protein (DUF1800 family)
MELFTLGRGFYTEQDIQEAARAFTGWGFNAEGQFVFRRNQHDFGPKTFRGQTGTFTGEDIISQLCDDRQTARYLTAKIYRYFVHPQPDPEVVETWAKDFYESDYQIGRLMERIFLSDHFYEPRNVGVRIKSPVEYLAGVMRLLDLEFADEDGAFILQKGLGQVLLQPPGVAGWPDGRSWIDSNSMMLRLKIPQALIFAAELDMELKEDFAGNEDAIKLKGAFGKRVGATINWSHILKWLEGQHEGQRLQALHDYLLQVPVSDPALVTRFEKGDTLEEVTKVQVMRLISTPEFQLC